MDALLRVRDERKLVPPFSVLRSRRSREVREHRLSSLCAQRSFYCAVTRSEEQRGESPLGAQANRLCSYCNGMP
jgi:hypothetical protein